MIDNLVKDKKLPGGKGDLTRPDQVDPAQLATGIQVEMEHTNDPSVAEEIALDHLTEDPEYYTKLIKAGLADEFGGSSSSGLGDPDQSFNDPARVGEDGVTPGNIKGKIGGTSNGQVIGRASTPIVDKSTNPFDGDGNCKQNKTIDIELQERKKKIRSIIDKVREGSIGNGVDRNPIQVFDGPSPAETSPEGLGTFGSGYDFVGYAENKQYMKQQRLQEIIKALSRKSLREQDEEGALDAPETPSPEGPEGVDAPETAEVEDQITLTIDRATAQKLHDLLMQVLQPSGGEGEAPTETDDQLPPGGEAGEGPVADGGDEGSEESAIGEITFEQSKDIDEAKSKWIQKAISKKGALHKQLNVPAGEKIPKSKLKAAAEKGGKLGKRARLAMTLSKLKKK